MNENQTPGQASSLCWQALCGDLHKVLERPDPETYADLRLQAAERLREMDRNSPARRELALELQLLDLHGALCLCTPRDAETAWHQLEQSAGEAQQQADTRLFAQRCRYIAAVLMLQAGLRSLAPAELDALRALLPQQNAPDNLLVRAMLQDALLHENSALAMRACCLALTFDGQATEPFEVAFRQLCLTLLDRRAGTEQLAKLLRASHSYAHWQQLDGPLWQACLQADIICLANWKLHLEAHERCHDWMETHSGSRHDDPPSP